MRNTLFLLFFLKKMLFIQKATCFTMYFHIFINLPYFPNRKIVIHLSLSLLLLYLIKFFYIYFEIGRVKLLFFYIITLRKMTRGKQQQKKSKKYIKTKLFLIRSSSSSFARVVERDWLHIF